MLSKNRILFKRKNLLYRNIPCDTLSHTIKHPEKNYSNIYGKSHLSTKGLVFIHVLFIF